MVVLPITPEQFEQVRDLVLRRRWDWPAVFSTNCHGEVWPWVTYGLTREEYREHVQELPTVIAEVATLLLEERPNGGRFFIDTHGACYKDLAGGEKTFVYFRMTQ